MGFPSFFPQNKAAVEKYGKKYGTSSKYMVYDGPFKMTGWTGTNLSWTLAKNKNYWDKSHVKLDKINFKVNKSTTTSYNLYQSKNSIRRFCRLNRQSSCQTTRDTRS